ncbi:YybH family protein [Pseudoduganella sp. S-14]|jgi:ketosteroid isomerase-like protein|uniref:YybH family protein n=1 Tax=Pseudoduganella sp. S-14 TaxID=3404065 RepID=UPI003CF3D820
MKKMIPLLAFAATAACTTIKAPPSNAELKQQVADTERAFAATMARRDHQAFASFLADEAIFYSGPKVLRGRDTVAAEWKAFYEKPEPPFNWEPDQVEVLDSGTLAHSSGPVRDPQGKVTGRFNSVWRQDAPGKWRIVFDKGERVCDCRKP